MSRPPFQIRSLILLALALWTVAAATARADVTYEITVDTSSIAAGTQGYLDFQFNAGGSSAQPASALVTDFFTPGLSFGALDLTGAATEISPLPGGLILLNNLFALNEGLQAVTFGPGHSFAFEVILSGQAIDTPNGQATAGTTFSLSVLDDSYNPLLPFASPVDPLLTIDIAPIGGTVSATNLARAFVTVSAIGTVVAVPEPSSWLCVGLGLALVGGIWRAGGVNPLSSDRE